MLVDSMELALEAFLGCRHLGTESETLLTVLISSLEQVREQGELVLAVPETRVASLSIDCKRRIEASPETAVKVRDPLPEGSRQLVDLCYFAAIELRRLWGAGSHGAVRSLGYAVHVVPPLVATGRVLNPRLYEFNFRIAAFHWAELSPQMRGALANAAGLGLEKAERLARADGFAIEMYRSSKTTQ